MARESDLYGSSNSCKADISKETRVEPHLVSKIKFPPNHILLVTGLPLVYQTVAQKKLLISPNGTLKIKWQLVRIGRFRKETLRTEMISQSN